MSWQLQPPRRQPLSSGCYVPWDGVFGSERKQTVKRWGFELLAELIVLGHWFGVEMGGAWPHYLLGGGRVRRRRRTCNSVEPVVALVFSRIIRKTEFPSTKPLGPGAIQSHAAQFPKPHARIATRTCSNLQVIKALSTTAIVTTCF